MNLSFDTVSDTMPVGRIKRTHPVGTTTLVEFIAQADTPYTGMFKGAKHGVMRISEFAETRPHVPDTAPGVCDQSGVELEEMDQAVPSSQPPPRHRRVHTPVKKTSRKTHSW